MMTITINKISPHLIWIFGLLEMITVPLVAWLPQVVSIGTKSALEGALVGFVGIIILFLILNKVIPRLNIKVDNQSVIKISVFSTALWNTLLLALIFGLQNLVGLFHINSWIANCIIAGFVSAAGAVFITLLIYQFVGRYVSALRILLKTNGNNYWIKNITVFTISLLAGMYEAIALPIILLWQRADTNVPLIAALTGLVGGIAGSFIILLAYNQLKFNRLTVSLEKMEE